MTRPGVPSAAALANKALPLSGEPELRIGLGAPSPLQRVFLAGRYELGGSIVGPGWCTARGGQSIVIDCGDRHMRATAVAVMTPQRATCTFSLPAVAVGAGFHWSRPEDLTYPGTLEIVRTDSGDLVMVNRIGLEEYLASVISSEMNPRAPGSFLQAHAIAARSWVRAQLAPPRIVDEPRPEGVDLWEWFDRSNHSLFDLCADDHCQRYHGQTRRVPEAVEAVRQTRGIVIHSAGIPVDARFSKCCGGMTEAFRTAWGGPSPAGLSSIADAHTLPAEWTADLTQEREAARWILGRPPAFCGVTDHEVIQRVLLPMDLATLDFFRWVERYSQERLAATIEERTNAGLGDIKALIPLRRGASGRIELLQIQGTKGALRVGKELTIRRILSPSHLKSSAFVVATREVVGGVPRQIQLDGAGWGHGVGMCQVGAGAMAVRGAGANDILTHYFPEAAQISWY